MRLALERPLYGQEYMLLVAGLPFCSRVTDSEPSALAATGNQPSAQHVTPVATHGRESVPRRI